MGPLAMLSPMAVTCMVDSTIFNRACNSVPAALRRLVSRHCCRFFVVHTGCCPRSASLVLSQKLAMVDLAGLSALYSVEVYACNTKVQDQGVSDSVQCLHIWSRKDIKGCGPVGLGASGTAAAYSFDALLGACPCRQQGARRHAVARYISFVRVVCGRFQLASNANWLTAACACMQSPPERTTCSGPNFARATTVPLTMAVTPQAILDVVRARPLLERNCGNAQASHIGSGNSPCAGAHLARLLAFLLSDLASFLLPPSAAAALRGGEALADLARFFATLPPLPLSFLTAALPPSPLSPLSALASLRLSFLESFLESFFDSFLDSFLESFLASLPSFSSGWPAAQKEAFRCGVPGRHEQTHSPAMWQKMLQ
jgi:hypothetical protein